MDRLDELQVFLAILDSGSMAAAARKLRRSPPVVTRTLNALEQRVGARLFERSTRHLSPSDEGLRLAELARRLLADYDTAIREAQQAEPRGLLRVTAPLVFGRRHLAPVVAKFLIRFPEVQVDLVLAERNVDMIDDGIDLALRIGRLDGSSLVARKLGVTRRTTVASPDYLHARGTPSTPAALSQHDLILDTTIRGLPEWRYRIGENEQVVRINPRLMLNDVETVLNAAREGFGIARTLSYQVAPDLAAGTLIRLLPNYEPEPLPVQLVLPSTRLMSPRVRAFLDFAVEELSSLDLLR